MHHHKGAGGGNGGLAETGHSLMGLPTKYHTCFELNSTPRPDELLCRREKLSARKDQLFLTRHSPVRRANG